MEIQDGYYFIFGSAPSPGTFSLACDTASGRATVQASSNRAQFLAKSSSIVFRIQSVGKGAHLIYNEKYDLALALQALGGGTVTLRPLDEDDQKQWWKIERGPLWTLTTYLQRGPKMSLETTGVSGSDVQGANYKPGSPGQQWRLYCISEDEGPDDVEVEENRDWLREMLRYYTSNIPQAYNVIGSYPYDRSHITHPNAELRKAIQWQNR
ncbi:hypothetical protein F4802DRAFT_571706 [Xylaria palmicola]|nr:hypothetical protein F4802DRAFT_571706 [Xylaria palmicola]